MPWITNPWTVDTRLKNTASMRPRRNAVDNRHADEETLMPPLLQ